jgi:hypothetical protein
LDTVSPFPQYERIQNYIGFIKDKKLEAKRKQRKATPQKFIEKVRDDLKNQGEFLRKLPKIKLTKEQVHLKNMAKDLIHLTD